MAALSGAVINARGCDIGGRGRFEGSGVNGRVHVEDVFSLRVVGLVVWMKEKVSRSRSSFYTKNGAYWQSLLWRPSSQIVLVVPLQPLI